MELKSGKKLEASLVVVGVGAKPNTEMFKGQLDLLEDKPGGVKASCLFENSSCLLCMMRCALLRVIVMSRQCRTEQCLTI